MQTIFFATEVGAIKISATDKGICFLGFVEDDEQNNDICNNEHLDLVVKELDLYFKKQLQEFTVNLDVEGTEFQKSVWKCLQKIPYGEQVSYAQQAKMLGNPKAVRAVANANARNKVSIIIPCHRVVGSDGSLTGYAYGVERKKFLLDLEKNN